MQGNKIPRTSRALLSEMTDGDSAFVIVDEKSHIHKKYSAASLHPHLVEAFLDKKSRLEEITWKEVKNSDKQGRGSRPLPLNEIKLSIPESARKLMEDEQYLYAKKGFRGFKYYTKKYCMVGLRVRAKFYIFWIDQKPYDIYDH